MADMKRQQQVEQMVQIPSKGKTVRKVLLIILITVLIGFLLFVYLKDRNPDWLGGNETESTSPDSPENKTVLPPVDDDESESSLNLIFLFILLGLVVLGGYVFFTNKQRSNKGIPPKEPITPDEAESLFLENFALRYKIPCKYSVEDKQFQPASDDSVLVNDKIPFFHTPTGDNFLFLEIEVREGKLQGIHTVIIPLDRGKDIIKNGYYRIDSHTPKFQFRLNQKLFPMSSMMDKQDRMKLALLEKTEERELPNIANLFKQDSTQQSQPTPNLSQSPPTSYEQYPYTQPGEGDTEGLPNQMITPVSYPYQRRRRKSTYRPRRYTY